MTVGEVVSIMLWSTVKDLQHYRATNNRRGRPPAREILAIGRGIGVVFAILAYVTTRLLAGHDAAVAAAAIALLIGVTIGLVIGYTSK